VLGVADTLASDVIHFICLDGHITRGQLRDIAMKYLRDHPQELHFSAHSEIGVALMKAFPCKDQLKGMQSK
jgi:hypothetical protein